MVDQLLLAVQIQPRACFCKQPYWNIGMPMHLQITYDCFHTSRMVLSSGDRHHMVYTV